MSPPPGSPAWYQPASCDSRRPVRKTLQPGRYQVDVPLHRHQADVVVFDPRAAPGSFRVVPDIRFVVAVDDDQPCRVYPLVLEDPDLRLRCTALRRVRGHPQSRGTVRASRGDNQPGIYLR